MKKWFISLFTLLLSVSLLCPSAGAAQPRTVMGLTEGYSLVGGVQILQAHSAMEHVEESYWASPVVTDLEGDGKLDVLVLAYSLTVADAATGAVKWRINSGRDRTTPYQWFYTDPAVNVAGQSYCDMVVKDLDGDGRKEIVIGYSSGLISVLDDKGYFKPGWPVQIPNESKTTGGPFGVRSLVVDDVDGDGKQEVIAGLGVAYAKSIYVYGCDGKLKPGWPQRQGDVDGILAVYSDGTYANGITTGDLDGDGLPEILMPTDNPFINAYNGDGTLVAANGVYGQTASGKNRPWCSVGMYEDEDEELQQKNGGYGWGFRYEPDKTRKQLYRPGLSSSTLRYVDVDGDGTSEIVTSLLMIDFTNAYRAPQGTRNCFTVADSKYMTVAILNQDHTRFHTSQYDWTSYPTNLTHPQLGGPLNLNDTVSVYDNVQPVPVVADVNGDGKNEILLNSFDGKVHCFGLDGKEFGSWPYVLPQTDTAKPLYEFATEPVVADLDGDGNQEVVFASWTDNGKWVTARDGGLSRANPGVDGAIYVLDGNGNLLTRRSLHQAVYQYNNVPYSNGSYAAPTVADIDGDGLQEILVNTRYYGLCAYKITPGVPTREVPLAEPRIQKVVVNGNTTSPATVFNLYAYLLTDENGGGTYYVQVRDIAWYMANCQWVTNHQGIFDVSWDGAVNLTPRKSYAPYPGHQDPKETLLRFVGAQPFDRTPTTIKVNGKPVTMDYIILRDANGNGSTYYKLRDLGAVMGVFDVGWDNATKTVTITTKP